MVEEPSPTPPAPEAEQSAPSADAAIGSSSGTEMMARQKSKNRLMAVGMVVFAVMVFATAVLTGVLSDLSGSGAANDTGTPALEAQRAPTMPKLH